MYNYYRLKTLFAISLESYLSEPHQNFLPRLTKISLLWTSSRYTGTRLTKTLQARDLGGREEVGERGWD